jgi:crotonobetainyl-CoA:carnitine CoA-transferase CaiB-like acyl-CoA transferase
MEANRAAKLPLSGVRIIAWSLRQTGPSATQLLGDMGAEVIKVETPAGGDSHRGATKDAGTMLTLDHGLPYGFEILNRNKKSITVDLSKEEGRKIIYSLITKADVFVQNFRYGVAKKLGVDYESLKKYNPSLVYANCTGYGTKGKQASQAALDPAIHAASGMMLGIGEAGQPPVHLPGAISDQITGIMLAYAIMVALFCRERTGIGQEIDVSMLGTMIWVQTNNIMVTLLTKKSRKRQMRAKAPNPLVNHYRCSDDRWILLSHFQPQKYWPILCRVLGLQHLQDDVRFHTLKTREENCAEVIALLDEAFARKTRDEWVEIFAKEELIYSPIKDYWEVVNDPQVLENDYITEVDHPVLGRFQEIGIPVHLGETPGSIREPAPQLGQHTEEILVDMLGYSWEEVEVLRDKGVIL